MVTHVTQIPEPPVPDDPPVMFHQKASDSFAGLFNAIPQMNQQADEIEQIGTEAQAAKERAIQESDAALGYRNETQAARDAALPAAVTATDMAAQAVTAKEQTEEFRDEAQTAAASAVNRVAKTSDTGAALLPEGDNGQRPATGSIPAGALVVRGNIQDPAVYKAEYWDRVAAGWEAFASRTWVGQQVTAAVNAVKDWVNQQIGFAIIYPNGGTAAAPANVSINTLYASVNPFPGHHVICEAEVLLGGEWSGSGWYSNNTSAVGVAAQQKGDFIYLQTGATGMVSRSNLSGNAFGISAADVITPLPCRIKVRKLKGAVA